MSAIQEISNNVNFRNDLEKKNVRFLLESIFPEDGEIIEKGKVKGEVSRLGWKIKPEIWWNVKCNQTQTCYHIHFKVVETAIGDIYYFWNGKAYQNFTFVLDEEKLKNAVNEFVHSDKVHKLICE